MGDQLENLRQEMARRPAPQVPLGTEARPQFHHARVIAIASGKGGVGKTNVVINLATTLARRGQRVLILDADLGLANVDVLLGIDPPHTLWHAIYGQLPLSEVIYQTPSGLQVLAGASGMEGLADLPDTQRELLLKRLSYLEEQFDYLIIDCGAGVDHNVIGFTCAADEVLLICTPEPTAVIDVYGLIKLIHRRGGAPKLSLVMNMVDRPWEGQNAAETIRDVARQFLGLDIATHWTIPRDTALHQAVRRQQPIVELFPGAPASRALIALAEGVAGAAQTESPRMGFFTRVGRLIARQS